ncbi:MAG: enoyl-CoA hydratase-related protein [Halieaceae bacterium]|nr:enoyl-CoA hydratase-related protein [Halieaceae bacterium]
MTYRPSLQGQDHKRDQELLTAIDGPVARITFNRPTARNAITSQMVLDMMAFLDRVAADDSVRCVVLTGAGNHFMAGGDVSGFGQVLEMPSDERRKELERRVRVSIPIFKHMLTMPQPIVARVRGACAGAAVGFAACCDFIVADETALFLVAHVNIATSPDGATSYALPRKVGPAKALEMAMLGRKVSAQEACEWGLVSHLVATDQLDAQVEAIVEQIIALPASAVGSIKALFGQSFHNTLDDQLQLEAETFGLCASHPNFVEGVTAFLEKRKATFNSA